LKREAEHKAEKGLIRVTVYSVSGKIDKVTISGDFFFYPEDKLWTLEQAIAGSTFDEKELIDKIAKFYRTQGVVTPGVKPEDFVSAILKAITPE